MTYRPPHQSQRSPSPDPYARFDCAAFAMAMLIDRATVGGVRLTGGQVRAMTNEPKPDPSSPGLTVPQVVAVAAKLHVAIGSTPKDSRAGVGAGLRAGRGYIIPVIYGKLPAALRAIPTFTGGHMIYVDSLELGSAEAWVGDPLQHGYVKWPLSALWDAWAAYGTVDAFSRSTP